MIFFESNFIPECFVLFCFFCRLIDAEQPQILSRTDEFGWQQYYNLSTIYRWLDQMVSKYPKVLTDHYYGKSHEGQLLRAITVSHKKVYDENLLKIIREIQTDAHNDNCQLLIDNPS